MLSRGPQRERSRSPGRRRPQDGGDAWEREGGSGLWKQFVRKQSPLETPAKTLSLLPKKQLVERRASVKPWVPSLDEPLTQPKTKRRPDFFAEVPSLDEPLTQAKTKPPRVGMHPCVERRIAGIWERMSSEEKRDWYRQRGLALQRKKQLCKFWFKGKCENGAMCIWAHGEEELEVPGPPRPGLLKTKLCSHFEAGWCAQGLICPFAHGAHELLRGVRGGRNRRPNFDNLWRDEPTQGGRRVAVLLPRAKQAARRNSCSESPRARWNDDREPSAIARSGEISPRWRFHNNDSGCEDGPVFRPRRRRSFSPASSCSSDGEQRRRSRSPNGRSRLTTADEAESELLATLGPTPKGAVSVIIENCSDENIAEGVHGVYVPFAENHGRPAYKSSAPDKGFTAYMYFWDDGDGQEEGCGWWVGPTFGGDDVWIHHAGCSSLPPETGWNSPHDGPVDPKMTVKTVGSEVLTTSRALREISGRKAGILSALKDKPTTESATAVEEDEDARGSDLPSLQSKLAAMQKEGEFQMQEVIRLQEQMSERRKREENLLRSMRELMNQP